MSRTYTVKAVALALGVSAKWADNILSRHALPGVERSRQGIERRISDEGLLAIEFARTLNLELGVSVERAAAIVRVAMTARTLGEMSFTTSSGVSLYFPVAETERRLRERMVDAVDAVGRVKRGRPPQSS